MKVKFSLALFFLTLVVLQAWGGGKTHASSMDYPADVIGTYADSSQRH